MTEKLRGVFLRWSEARAKASELTRAAEAEGAAEDAGRAADAAVREAEGIEAELREAIRIEPVGVEVPTDDAADPELRERAAIRKRSRLGAFLAAAVKNLPVDGAEAELAAAAKCPGMLPVEIIGPELRALEKRVATPAPTTTGIQQHAIVPALFDRSVAPYLGVEMPMVPTGTPAYPYISTSLTASMRNAGQAAVETAGAFSVSTAEPRRLAGSLRLRLEDLARLEGMEDTLRGNLADVISDQLDVQILNGNGTAPNLAGVFQATADVAAETTVDVFADYTTKMTSVVDGLHAVGVGDVRALVSVETYRHSMSLWNTDETMLIGEHVMRLYGGWRATRRITATGGVATAIARRGMEAGMVKAPVWSGMELIRDPYTDAPSGEVIITATALVGGLAFCRAADDLFEELSFKHA